MITLLLLLVTSLPFSISVTFDDVSRTALLKITQGDLLGKRIDSYDTTTGYGFLGVPFGKPTDGIRRFAKPEPADGWKGVRNVTQKGDACPAVGVLTYKRPEGGPMSEDCLHSYIYTTKTCLTKGGCPIMWVLHGGRFNFESPVVFVDEAIVHNFVSEGKDVVVVIPAYRLENFGFLNIAPGIKTSAPQNVALWDLLLAMQWMKREIRHFGGNPNQITVFGHSAGSMLAEIISVSPHFAGTFDKMVLMSGTATALDAGRKSNSLASWRTVDLLGCGDANTSRTDVTAIEGVILCMRSKTWQEIVDANIAMNAYTEDYLGPHTDGPGGMLPQSMPTLAANRPAISTMLGTVSAEFHDTKYALNEDGTADIVKVGELCEGHMYSIGYAHPDVMSRRCMSHYMQGDRVKNLLQDVSFFMPTFLTAEGLAKKGNKVFLYSFTYKDIGAAFKKYSKLDKDDHPSHSEDYVYILGMHRGNFTARDYEIEKIYSGMVLNFVKTGYPNPGAGQPKWKPFTKWGRDYYEIDFATNKMPGMKKNYEKDAIELWVDEAEKYGGPITTPDEFAPHADRFYPLDMVSVFNSHYSKRSTAHDKTFEAEDSNYQGWMNYINNRRYKHLQVSVGVRSEIVDTPKVDEETPLAGSRILQVLFICVLAVMAFFILRCFCRCLCCQERKGYQEF